MTTPSKLLDTIATTLEERLAPLLPSINTPVIPVRITDDMTEDVIGDMHAPGLPCVLVTCTGLPQVGRETGDLTFEAEFVARCYSALPVAPGGAVSSRGDVAMNLAARVAAIVDSELWVDDNGEPQASARASRVAPRNRSTRGAAARGHSLWTVTWRQQLELTDVLIDAELFPFKKLHLTYAMGGADTPDAEATLQLEGGTPP